VESVLSLEKGTSRELGEGGENRFKKNALKTREKVNVKIN
jgi:hypothetical protein